MARQWGLSMAAYGRFPWPPSLSFAAQGVRFAASATEAHDQVDRRLVRKHRSRGGVLRDHAPFRNVGGRLVLKRRDLTAGAIELVCRTAYQQSDHRRYHAGRRGEPGPVEYGGCENVAVVGADAGDVGAPVVVEVGDGERSEGLPVDLLRRSKGSVAVSGAYGWPAAVRRGKQVKAPVAVQICERNGLQFADHSI